MLSAFKGRAKERAALAGTTEQSRGGLALSTYNTEEQEQCFHVHVSGMRTWGLGPSLSTAEANSSPEQGEQDWGHRDSSFWVIGELQLLAEDHDRARGQG